MRKCAAVNVACVLASRIVYNDSQFVMHDYSAIKISALADIRVLRVSIATSIKKIKTKNNVKQ